MFIVHSKAHGPEFSGILDAELDAVWSLIDDTGGYYAAVNVETALQEVGQELLVHNLGGFEDRSNSTLSWGGTRTLTLTPTGTDYYWVSGVRYAYSSAETCQIEDTSGTHVIFFDKASPTALSSIANPTHGELDEIIWNDCIVAIVYWATTYSAAYILADERHGVEMSGRTHEWLHDNVGSKYKSGGGLSAYTLGNSADADISFDVTDIEFYDEDIEIEIEHGVASSQYIQVLTGDAEIPVLFRDNVDGSWTEQAASTLPYLANGATPQYVKDDGDGTWSRVNVNNGKYYLHFLIVTNDWQYPVKMIPGSTQYANAAQARTGATTEFPNLGNLPSAEFVLLYTFILRVAAGGTLGIQITEIVDYRQSAISGASVVASDHGSLGGLGDDDHEQYILHSLGVTTNDFLVYSATASNYQNKTLAEVGAILEADLDHDNLQGIIADEHYAALDEDNMVSDSDVHVATQQSIKAYFDDNTTSLQRIHLKKSAAGEALAVGAPIDVAWDDLEYKDSGYYTHDVAVDNDEITIVNAGVYRITCNITFDNAIGSGRDVLNTYLIVNGGPVLSTYSYSYDRGTTYGGEMNTRMMTTISLSAADVLQIGAVMTVEQGAATIREPECELIIEALATEAASNTWRNMLDEDDMASDDPSSTASQQSIVAYIAAELAALGTLPADPGFDAVLLWDDSASSYVSVAPGAGLEITAAPALELSHLGFEDLTDPGADRIVFWDENYDYLNWLVVNTGLAIDGTNLNIDVSDTTWFVDQDDMADNSATKVASQQSIKAYVDNELAGVGGGNPWTYISAVSPAAVATVAFSNWSSTYVEIQLIFQGVLPATDNQKFRFQTSDDDGGTYQAGTIYTFSCLAKNDSGNGAYLASGTAGTTYASIAYAGLGSNGSTEFGYYGILHILDVNNTDRSKYIIQASYYRADNYIDNLGGGGVINHAGVVSAIRFSFASGNIESGHIHLYGRTAS